MDQVTYNRKLRNGGLMKLPIGTDDQGIEYHHLTIYEPRPERDQVVCVLREMFDGQYAAGSAENCGLKRKPNAQFSGHEVLRRSGISWLGRDVS